MSVYRPKFLAALQLFADVSAAMAARAVRPPILVGGAAVEFYTAGQIATGDFDVVVIRDDVFGQELLARGLRKEPAARGWLHPQSGFGFEVVGDRLLDGAAETDRVRIVAPDPQRPGAFVVIPVEDLIADRMGQHASGTAGLDMLEQARALFALHAELDLAYLERRIREETHGLHGVSDVRQDGAAGQLD